MSCGLFQELNEIMLIIQGTFKKIYNTMLKFHME